LRFAPFFKKASNMMSAFLKKSAAEAAHFCD